MCAAQNCPGQATSEDQQQGSLARSSAGSKRMHCTLQLLDKGVSRGEHRLLALQHCTMQGCCAGADLAICYVAGVLCAAAMLSTAGRVLGKKTDVLQSLSALEVHALTWLLMPCRGAVRRGNDVDSWQGAEREDGCAAACVLHCACILLRAPALLLDSGGAPIQPSTDLYNQCISCATHSAQVWSCTPTASLLPYITIGRSADRSAQE